MENSLVYFYIIKSMVYVYPLYFLYFILSLLMKIKEYENGSFRWFQKSSKDDC